MKFVSRAAWGARAPRSRTGLDPSSGTSIHWEGPGLGTFDHSTCASKVRGIQNYHMDARGWSDVAYSAIVCPHGYVFEGRWIGARTGANGTNAGNRSWYAICALVGTGDATPAAMVDAIHETAAYLRDPGRAGPRVNGHRDHKPTACPGDELYAIVRSGRFEKNPAGPPPPADEEDLKMDEKTKQYLDDRFDRLEQANNATRGDVWITADNLNKRYGSLRGWIVAVGLVVVGAKKATSYSALRELAHENDTYAQQKKK